MLHQKDKANTKSSIDIDVEEYAEKLRWIQIAKPMCDPKNLLIGLVTPFLLVLMAQVYCEDGFYVNLLTTITKWVSFVAFFCQITEVMMNLLDKKGFHCDNFIDPPDNSYEICLSFCSYGFILWIIYGFILVFSHSSILPVFAMFAIFIFTASMTVELYTTVYFRELFSFLDNKHIFGWFTEIWTRVFMFFKLFFFYFRSFGYIVVIYFFFLIMGCLQEITHLHEDIQKKKEAAENDNTEQKDAK